MLKIGSDLTVKKKKNITRGKEQVYLRLKRIQDIVLCSGGLVVLSPVFIAAAAAIKIEDPSSPVLFRQLRMGKDGKVFVFLKFRSMVPGAKEQDAILQKQNDKCDGSIYKSKEDPRVTKVGGFIRKYSIDELPQLINVLKGDMSVVGPRPRLVESEEAFTEYHNLVAPGLTCIWQVHPDKYTMSFYERISLDLEYIEKRSTALDLKIILKTVRTVLNGEGI